MIFIKHIDIVEAERDHLEVYSYSPKMFFDRTLDHVKEDDLISVEQVNGRIFKNKEGKKVCIGMSEQAQEALGLPFMVFESMQEQLDVCRNRNARLKETVDSYENMGFWQRLLFLFKKDTIRKNK